MALSPDRNLLLWVLAWFVLAVASVPLAGIRFLVPVSGLVLIAACIADAGLSLREARLGISRKLPARASRGARVEVELRLHNPLGRPINVEIHDTVPQDLLPEDPRWASQRLDRESERVLRYSVRPRVRGRRTFGVAVALVQSPFGLLRRRAIFDREQTLLVHPETERFLRPEALDPKRVLASLGVRPRRRRGDGIDFDSLREYVVGDEPRRIDWRATARRGRPIVRTHRHEESRTILLAVDCSRLMGARASADPSRRAGPEAEGGAGRVGAGFASTKLDHAVDAALALAFASLSAGDRVGLFVFDSSVRNPVAPVSNRTNLGRFVDALSSVAPSLVEADYRRMTREILARQRKRAMLVVLTDFIEVDREELVHPMALLARRHEVVFVALREPILDRLEEDPKRDERREAASDPTGLYRRIVLADLLREREGRLVALRRRGLSVLDVRPADATAATLNRFLELRYGST